MPRRASIALLLLLAAAVFGQAVHAAQTFYFTWSDENVHMYVVKQLAGGARLYGDLHSARPPVALLLPTLLMTLGLPPLWAMRVSIWTMALATGALIAWAGIKPFGRSQALLAAVIFFACPALMYRASFTGILTVSFFVTAFLLAIVHERPKLSGALAALAILSGQHALPIVGAGGVWFMLRHRRKALPMGFMFLIVATVIVGIVWLRGGHAIWTDLVGRHLYHFGSDGAAQEAGGEDFGRWVVIWGFDNLPAVLLAATAIALHGQWKLDHPIVPIVAGVAAHIGALVVMTTPKILYIQPLWAPLALLAGIGGVIVFDRVRATRARAVFVLTVLIFVAIGGQLLASRLLGERDRKQYSIWASSRLHRMAELRRPIVADKIAKLVEETGGTGTLFGHSTIVDLVAVLSDRRVSAQLADLDPRWIRDGNLERRDVLRQIEADGVQLFISPNWFWLKDPFFKKYLKACFGPARVFPREPGSGIPRIAVLQRDPSKCENLKESP